MITLTKSDIPSTSLFICQLPQNTQTQIKSDLEQYALANNIALEIDTETNEYMALSGRFCDIEEIYN